MCLLYFLLQYSSTICCYLLLIAFDSIKEEKNNDISHYKSYQRNHNVIRKWFAVCVCKILHVNLYMIQRNVFKVYKIDDQIWYTRNTALSETWQNGAPISLFSASWQDIIDGPVQLESYVQLGIEAPSAWRNDLLGQKDA